ncbi:bifunctional 2-polyprenyl-6-hydroxyphenol methylase/3-demethylubiquinol 3-O-methyltransferase UbiG [Fusibacter sp. 3D3]|uniref:class I SAM-dependent methyltransferase n=1 Tax=Fusibacter sp. 3D3 TaxID=1048380 RepID=UPI000853DCF6|nr:methyltransferase domain-containing protein [Fusibacter sp. 3D3]GAU75774.1 S-adenosylmethionine-dependent methyltransferase [Fusibacter sp. 3D3]
MKSESNEDINNALWQKETYNAYVNKYGVPTEAAQKIMKSPEKILHPIYPYFENVREKKIVNLMGSMGQKAVALSLLGAHVTVIDISPGNKQYATELAEACDCEIEYIIGDVLKVDLEKYEGTADIVFAEMGIIHYFQDLKPFFQMALKLLGQNGKFILRDFHPVSTKLITSRGSTAKVRKHKVTGNYFSTELEEQEVAFSKYSDEVVLEKVRLRKWTLGEVITALAQAGFLINELKEEQNLSSEVFDQGIPKTFTVVCSKL